VVQQKLILLQFTNGLMAKTGKGPAMLVRRQRGDLTALCFLLHYTPVDFGAESGSPDPPSPIHRAKETASHDSGSLHQGVNSSLYPVRDRNCSYVASLSDRIGYDPMPPSLLGVFNAQNNEFGVA
jgi:hypothetical protein